MGNNVFQSILERSGIYFKIYIKLSLTTGSTSAYNSNFGFPNMATNLFSWSIQSEPSNKTVLPISSAKMHPTDQMSIDLV